MKKLNVLFVIVKSNHIGNHVTMELEQLVKSVELIGRSLDSNLKTTNELECLFVMMEPCNTWYFSTEMEKRL